MTIIFKQKRRVSPPNLSSHYSRYLKDLRTVFLEWQSAVIRALEQNKPVELDHEKLADVLYKHNWTVAVDSLAYAKERLREATKQAWQIQDRNVWLGTAKQANTFIQEMKDYLKQKGLKQSKVIRDRVKGDINKIIARGLQNADPKQKIARAIARRFSDLREWEAKRIVESETQMAHNHTFFKYCKKEGVKKFVWRTFEPCDECASKEGIYTVEQLNNDLPPIHPSCRCTVDIYEGER